MGRKTQIAIVVAVVGLVALAAGAYAYDGSQKAEIARGVTIGGIDVGGMTREQASETVRNRLLAPQRKPLTVRFKKEKFKLQARKLKIRADINGAVDRAFEESRSGSLPTRVVRELTGGELQAAIPAKVAYSKRAVNRFVGEVADGVRVDPVDATVSATGDSLGVVDGREGHRLRENMLTRRITSILESGRGSRTLTANVRVLKPKVTRKDVASEYPTYLTLNRSTFQLRLWKNLKLAKTYTVAVGQVGLDTPAGLYSIQNKAVDPVWTVPNSAWAGDQAGQVVPGGTPENPLKARWMGIYDGAGIHGTSETYSLGSAASHGCVRMAIPDVIDLYDQVDVGTPIYIG
ncbi:MAG: L,D-transpeptidase/peptidoglycan binding protein [Solirubrobacterales bacterium]|nr:L,D-transpeptidase/peptidoglycan binding protein [Solirubrobacterales bacterium]